MKLPIVKIEFIDHSADLDGISGPYTFMAVGVLLSKTEQGYVLGHWLHWDDIHQPKGLGNVTTFIAKVVGMKVTKIGELKIT